MKKYIKKVLSVVSTFFIVCGVLLSGTQIEAWAATGNYYPNEIMLGTFFNSEKDMTDTLYVSFDGYTFDKIGEAYTDKYPNSRSAYQMVRYGESQVLDVVDNNETSNSELNEQGCFHDPSINYRDGYFWILSGGIKRASDPEPNSEREPDEFIPVWGYSKDLINWSYGWSGLTEHNIIFTDLKYAVSKSEYDAVAPDAFFDDNGDIWIVVSAGYFASWHGDSPVNDKMSPYLIKVNQLEVNEDKIAKIERDGKDEATYQAEIKSVQPLAKYSEPISINLLDDSINQQECDDRIDGSISKIDGKYYLVIKRNGVTNEIWRIDDLNNASDSNAWTLIDSDFLYEYEGPCMTEFNDDYYIYSDKLSKVPGAEGEGNTGIYVSCASDVEGFRKVQTKVNLRDYNGNTVDGRHGSIINLKRGEEAYNKVISRYIEVYGNTSNASIYSPSAVTMNGLFRSNGELYLYENGVMATSKEVYDEKTDAWYWFDEDGTMARNKEVYIPYTSDRTEGKWVYYDSEGHMVKGECYHDNFWYYYDLVTGERAAGFVYLPDNDKWVYYNSEGHMLYGEQYINGYWYRFEEGTGKMVHGEYCSNEGNWYYYDSITGVMHYGLTTLPDGTVHYYNIVTGIMEW